MNEQKIQMVFFDAVGTLFDVRGSVGEIYARVAAQYGQQVEAAALQRAFVRQFRQQPPLAFAPTLGQAARLQLEQDWWRTLVRNVFARVGEFPQVEKFEAYFVEIFKFFRRAEAWQIFADTEITLAALKARGYRLGLISNFDARLYDVLRGLRLHEQFDSIHISTEVGAAKPDAEIFRVALRENGLVPAQALHVGDRWQADVQGAMAAGLHVVWLNRPAASLPDSRVPQVFALRQILELI